MTDITPMAKQYQEIKSLHKDAILFFRLGDFYEMFNEDALLASKELEITLTGRGEGANRMPMCGIPYHAAEGYIARLIAKGYKVAICEQLEDVPAKGQSLVRREVIKIITPGTVIEPKMLSEKKSNWLAAVSFNKDAFGLAVIDASTGDFRATQLKGKDAKEKLFGEIERIRPAECLLPDIIPQDLGEIVDLLKVNGVAITTYKDIYDKDVAREHLKQQFSSKPLESFGVQDISATLGAAAAVIDYLRDTQKTTLNHINSIRPYRVGEYMFLDSTSLKNLEIETTIKDRSFKGSLLWVLDRASTSMGSRLLHNWLLEPLLDTALINERLDAVSELSASTLLRGELERELKDISDIERLTGKVATGSSNARDLVSLKESVRKLPRLKEVLKGCKSKLLKEVLSLDDMNEVLQKIDSAIVDDPPFGLKEGGLIKNGFNKELDELKSITSGGKQWIADLEASERQRTGIKSLKVGFTKVFGYYIEVTNSNLSQVPPDYIRKQTLTNCERFITPDLKDRESMILNAEERMNQLEYQLFSEVRDFVAKYSKGLQNIGRTIAKIDALLSFALVGVANKYVRPELIKDSKDIIVKDGRHPVVEMMFGQYNFVPNDINLNSRGSRFLLITGPNMAGKSTYMRQAALIVIMAQIGCFVPAASAKIGLVDRIFTRIGAMDDIFSGQSTFMVEMTETANILHNATDRSLIILDEIGRGTSTFDGMSIAASVAEFIHEKISARTLFATHYHEITQLADKHAGMKNLNTSVLEKGDQITFLHKIVEGPSDQSYGIQVAKLAGLPDEVISRAKEIYSTLEMVENDLGQRKAEKKIGKIVKKEDIIKGKRYGVRGKGEEGRQQINLF